MSEWDTGYYEDEGPGEPDDEEFDDSKLQDLVEGTYLYYDDNWD